MSFLARLSPAGLSKPKPTIHTALSTVFHLKTAAVLGACLYQYLSARRVGGNQDARQGLSKRRRTRCVREFVGDRVEEWWGIVGRGKDGSWIEARREIKARWRAEKEKSRRARLERKIKREESARIAGISKDKEDGKNRRKGTILRVTFPWGGRGKR